MRVWHMNKDWLGLHDVHPSDWSDVASVKEWWSHNATKKTQSRRPPASLMLLIFWELWNERNARIFRNNAVLVGVIVARIKEETSLWSMAGARHLGNIMLRE
ncbi:hypothetical protein VPH35_022034 [Triticum aestivum]